ncbi:hypothetical protein BC831DRAFT_189128 [Entophlyctis helioformis]|nr:hypothetical protein BC831DRAFT_189128 [Entophlyctis helioformis]
MTFVGLLRAFKVRHAVCDHTGKTFGHAVQRVLHSMLPQQPPLQQPPLQQPPPQQQTATAATTTAATTTAATTQFISGMLHVDFLSIFHPALVATAAISQPGSKAGWKAIIQPAFEQFMASLGGGHTIRFHVDGQLGDLGLKLVHNSRTNNMLHAAAKVLQHAFQRQEGRHSGSLSKTEKHALHRFFCLTIADKKAIYEALSELAGSKEACTVCPCDYEADVCIACRVRESSDQPIIVIANDSDLVAHCAGHCAVILTHLEHGQLVQMRSYNHGGLATMASVLGVRDFAGACQLVAALSRTDYFGRPGHGELPRLFCSICHHSHAILCLHA